MDTRSEVDALRAELAACIRAGDRKAARAVRDELNQIVNQRETAVLRPDETRGAP